MNYNKLEDQTDINIYFKDTREYKCLRCGEPLPAYSCGLGRECICENCGYKDPCCE